ncbi:ferrochelatase [Rhodobium gokarnense]|uniref:Ferrochelatase n=1 Tax=Rhodobium gokarnense TaxID=364296 RepID=A0ABT3H6N9_9HYPH|nr:ferrochelatase [Rhodobium gokarnense]
MAQDQGNGSDGSSWSRRAIRFPDGHEEIAAGRIGVLLVNLGTPDGTDYWSMRRYLKEFLSDRRVVEAPRLIWWPVLNGIILSTRPQKSGALYDKVWNTERNESPLRTITRSQGEKLAADLARTDPRIIVDWAMRYGNPSIAEKLDALTAEGADRLLIVPLYPQYSAATTATVNDKAFEALSQMRWQPAVRTAPPYHDDPAYIEALAASTKKHLAELDFEPDIVLASFHGIPKSYFEKGDPYHCQCQKTVRLLREALGWAPERLMVTFQSRFGREEWLKPYTDETVARLAREGVRKMAVIMPGFAADCLETLEEIAGENAEIFEENGGEHFAALPCLNDSEEGMAVIRAVVLRELSGWI